MSYKQATRVRLLHPAPFLYPGIAQLAEHAIDNREIVGSSPTPWTILERASPSGKAPGFQPGIAWVRIPPPAPVPSATTKQLGIGQKNFHSILHTFAHSMQYVTDSKVVTGRRSGLKIRRSLHSVGVQVPLRAPERSQQNKGMAGPESRTRDASRQTRRISSLT